MCLCVFTSCAAHVWSRLVEFCCPPVGMCVHVVTYVYIKFDQTKEVEI